MACKPYIHSAKNVCDYFSFKLCGTHKVTSALNLYRRIADCLFKDPVRTAL